MKFLSTALRRLTPRRFKTVKVAPISATMDLNCPFDNEVQIHQTELRNLESRCKELQSLTEENEKLYDLKIICEKQRDLFPELKLECCRARNKLNKVLRKIWLNTRFWTGVSDLPQQLMQFCNPAVECREQIALTNEIIREYMDSIDFYDAKILQSEKQRQQLTMEFEDEIERLESKLLDCTKELLDLSPMVRHAVLTKNEKDVSDVRWVSKSRYSKMVASSNQLEEVRSVNNTLKGMNWEEEYMSARDINLVILRDLARWTSEIELAKKIATVVLLQNSLKRAIIAIHVFIPRQEQPNVRAHQAIYQSADEMFLNYRNKRDQAERIKAAVKCEQIVFEQRVIELDLKLRMIRGHLQTAKTF
jgi:hypothetical protein